MTVSWIAGAITSKKQLNAHLVRALLTLRSLSGDRSEMKWNGANRDFEGAYSKRRFIRPWVPHPDVSRQLVVEPHLYAPIIPRCSYTDGDHGLTWDKNRSNCLPGRMQKVIKYLWTAFQRTRQKYNIGPAFCRARDFHNQVEGRISTCGRG